ncbi:MAG: TetR/AcrR family transcriptional regulator [Methanobacteriaceae archaeon]|nr:TetR/AcrR family transcriptional regulator [Methanobacteriaceae archaeon]
MAADTEERILDAALQVFSKNGYNGARTRVIAKKSGFTEMTLFRKFETKENLFNQVIVKNQERIMKDVYSLLDLSLIEEPKECFRNLIMKIVDLMDKNFEYVNILIYERERIPHSITKKFIFRLAEYLEKMFPQIKVDHYVLSFNILSFLYFITFNQKRGDDFFDVKSAVEEFIAYNSTCLRL